MEFYLKEFDSCRAQADRYIRELFTLERYTVAVYAWLFTNNENPMIIAEWYLPLFFGLLAAFRSLAIGWQLVCLSGYLKQLEELLLKHQKNLDENSPELGWENYWRKSRGTRLVTASAVLFWVILLFIQIAAPHVFFDLFTIEIALLT